MKMMALSLCTSIVSVDMSYLFVQQEKTETVDLNSDNTLLVDISDALSERDKVKFTVHTKVTVTSMAFRSMPFIYKMKCNF